MHSVFEKQKKIADTEEMETSLSRFLQFYMRCLERCPIAKIKFMDYSSRQDELRAAVLCTPCRSSGSVSALIRIYSLRKNQ